LNRLKRTRANISLSKLQSEDEFYNSDNERSEAISLREKSEIVSGILTSTLKKHHFRVTEGQSTNKFYVAADKNRFSPLGTYLIHSGIILLIIGYLGGSFLGFKDNSFVVPEGAQRSIGHDTGLTIQLNSFTSESWPDGSPKDFRSEVTLKRGEQGIKSETVRVNHPLNYGGIRIYQSFYGPATHIQIKYHNDGKILFDGNIALDGVLEDHTYQRPSGGFRLTQEGYILFFVGRATNMEDIALKNGQVAIEIYQQNSNTPIASTALDKSVPFIVKDLEISYLGDAVYSGFQISRDPGVNLIWAAAALFLLGLVMVFYFPRRRLWALILNNPQTGSHLWLRAGSSRSPGIAGEIDRIITEIKRSAELKVQQPNLKEAK
jgi:cytochrome c biogenesis protein